RFEDDIRRGAGLAVRSPEVLIQEDAEGELGPGFGIAGDHREGGILAAVAPCRTGVLMMGRDHPDDEAYTIEFLGKSSEIPPGRRQGSPFPLVRDLFQIRGPLVRAEYENFSATGQGIRKLEPIVVRLDLVADLLRVRKVRAEKAVERRSLYPGSGRRVDASQGGTLAPADSVADLEADVRIGQVQERQEPIALLNLGPNDVAPDRSLCESLGRLWPSNMHPFRRRLPDGSKILR